MSTRHQPVAAEVAVAALADPAAAVVVAEDRSPAEHLSHSGSALAPDAFTDPFSSRADLYRGVMNQSQCLRPLLRLFRPPLRRVFPVVEGSCFNISYFDGGNPAMLQTLCVWILYCWVESSRSEQACSLRRLVTASWQKRLPLEAENSQIACTGRRQRFATLVFVPDD